MATATSETLMTIASACTCCRMPAQAIPGIHLPDMH